MLRENRRLTSEERAKVKSMQKSYVPIKAIQREMIKSTGKHVLVKDISNIRTKTDREERRGRGEENMLEQVLADILRKYTGAFLNAATDPKTNQLLCVTIVTSEMQNNFGQNPNLVFLDGTYKMNQENYCLYALVVQIVMVKDVLLPWDSCHRRRPQTLTPSLSRSRKSIQNGTKSKLLLLTRITTKLPQS